LSPSDPQYSIKKLPDHYSAALSSYPVSHNLLSIFKIYFVLSKKRLSLFQAALCTAIIISLSKIAPGIDCSRA
jgi:hypothetical protein